MNISHTCHNKKTFCCKWTLKTIKTISFFVPIQYVYYKFTVHVPIITDNIAYIDRKTDISLILIILHIFLHYRNIKNIHNMPI